MVRLHYLLLVRVPVRVRLLKKLFLTYCLRQLIKSVSYLSKNPSEILLRNLLACTYKIITYTKKVCQKSDKDMDFNLYLELKSLYCLTTKVPLETPVSLIRLNIWLLWVVSIWFLTTLPSQLVRVVKG